MPARVKPSCWSYWILGLATSLMMQGLALAADQGQSHQTTKPPPSSSITPAIIKNALGMELVLVPAGEFEMGAATSPEEVLARFPKIPVDPSDLADEYPPHRVRITRPFYMGQHEVTVGQFRRFVQETGYKTQAESDGTGGWGYDPITRKSEERDPRFNWANTGYPQSDRHPVINVSYHDAQAFLAWLNRQEAGARYRLPTEAEWEYAHRAGSRSLYAHGDDPQSLPRFARAIDTQKQTEFAHVQNLEFAPDDASAFPAPVGSHAPNAWGLYDMHGNVWEWVSDWYGEDYYKHSPTEDPQGPAQGEVRVRRGGAWNSFPIWLRSSFRNINTEESRCINLGFRVVRDF